jgi:DNA-binding beta-propeller fold protein YncE
MLLWWVVLGCNGTVEPSMEDAGRASARDADSPEDAAPGDSGASAGDAGDRDGGMPTGLAEIVFPLPSVTNADSVAVRVRADGATAASVNGVAAERAGSDFVARVPLAPGENTLAAEATTPSGPRVAETTIVRSDDLSRGDTAWGEARAFSLVASAGEALFADDIFDGVVRIDYANGDHAWIACTESSSRCGELGGTGVDMVQPLDVDVVMGRVIATDGDHLVEIDLTTHDTTTIAGRGVGSGPDPSRMSSLIFDATRSVAVVLDWDLSTISRIDLTNGDRTLLSGDGAGSGPEIRAAQHLAYDPTGDRALFFQQYVPQLYAVDLESGARSVVSDRGVGSGPEIGDPEGIAVDPIRRIAYTIDAENGSIVAIDLATGDRRVVASTSVGEGPRPTSASLAFARDLLFARDDETLFAIDPASGDGVVISR